MTEVLLEARGICKSFPGVKALDNVSFNLRKGEVHALLGENGAGKSTLMKILAGVQSPDSGSLFYKGTKVHFTTALEAQRAGISIIFQELNLVPHLSIAQNIFIGKEPRTRWGTVDEKKMNDSAEVLLARLNLKISTKIAVKDLSISTQQMVEIAKALSHDSDVVIMDEPTSALTESEITELFDVIHSLRDRGVGIIYISHRLEELRHIVDRISIFRDGQFISTDDYQAITMDEIVNRMVGRQLTNKFPHRKNVPTSEKLMEVTGLRQEGILHGISFDLRRGEILGIAGLMGAGRTELARAIFGADPIDSGSVVVNGQKLEIRSPRDAIRFGVAYLSEDRKNEGLAVRMEIGENISLASLSRVCGPLSVISREKEQLASRRYVEELNIRTPSLTQKVNNLSGGNQQKVVLAKWLFCEAKILIFDEPTRGIDVGAKYAIYELIEKLAIAGVGIIMISSELPEIMGMTDRVLVLHEGELTATLVTKNTNQEEILSFAAGVERAQNNSLSKENP